MTVCQQGTLLLVTLCILSLWLTSTLLGCYEEEGDGAPPHHEGVGETTPMSSPGEARAKEVGTQYYDTLNIDEEYQQKLKDIVLWFQSEVESIPVQPSCPIHASFAEESSSPSDIHLTTFGSLHLPEYSNQSAILLTDILKEVSSALPRSGSAVVAQLGAGFGGAALDSSMANSLAGLLKSLDVSVVSVANNGVEGRPGKMDIWVQALHDNHLEWVGLQVRQGTLVNLNGVLTGIVAFCTHNSGCHGSRDQPLSPAKYSQKAATEKVKELRKAGARAIVVLMYWGKPHNLYPTLSQKHAYFGKTFIVFSPGRLLVHESELCWQNVHGQPVFMEQAAECEAVPPQQREQLRLVERQTKLYHLTLSYRSGHAVAAYKTVPLKKTGGILRPVMSEGSDWTPACSETDTNCLACRPA